MLKYMAIFFAAFTLVFFKSFQQRNVAYENYFAIIPTSLFLAAAEFLAIAYIASIGMQPIAILVYALGAGTGSLGATILHKKYMTRKQIETR